jgi:hypothetical protein
MNNLEESTDTPHTQNGNETADLQVFWKVTLAWLLLLAPLAVVVRGNEVEISRQLGWTLLIAVLSVLDLWVLAQTLFSAIAWMNSSSDTRIGYALKTGYWGASKLACLILLGWVITKGQAIPDRALFLGLGTLAVVPLAGGWFWARNLINLSNK